MGENDATRPPSGQARGAAGMRARVGQYELIREIGRGGMGTVYLARDTRLARRVAIKFIAYSSAAMNERFLVEARATAQCNHENIVVIHEVDELEGQPYMVLEYLEGKSLRELLDGTPMSPGRAIELIVPVARALACAHERSIVHRDLKPENIFVTNAGQVKVLDFGIAKVHGEPDRDGDDEGTGEHTQASGLVGTLAYMAPEQWGADDVDHRCDLWALGIVLYELLAGRHPIQPTTKDRLMSAAMRPDEPMPALGSPSIDAELQRVVARCLAKRKAGRFATAAELVAALEPLLPRRRAVGAAEIEPYPGLTAFREEDADLFHGRRSEVARLSALLRDRPLVGVVGASGAGKSSLVRAGLIPELKSREAWEALITRPGRHPLDALAVTVAGEADSASLATKLANEPGALGVRLRERARTRGGKILLFVDQFEELYTLADDRARAAYLACLRGAADDPLSPTRVVVSLRSDFLDRVATDAQFVEALSPGMQFVVGADRDGLRAALVEPAQYAGYRFETTDMIETMVDELATTAGALPLLQFAASSLWQQRDRGQRLLTRAAYDRIGGIAGALASHADAVIASMPPATRDIARQVLVRLVTPERTRDVVEVAELHELRDARAVIDHLAAARLVAIRSDQGPAVVELVHESLIERWPALRGWLDQTQGDTAFLARVRTAAKQWDDAARSPGLLWHGDPEQDARRWLRDYAGELGSRERAYLDAVFQQADRAARRRRFAIGGTIAMLGLLVVAAIVALVFIRDAQTEAEREASRAHDEANKASKANRDLSDALANLQRETAAREAARQAEAAATQQVNAARVDLERVNGDLRIALTRAEAESNRAKSESERAKRESEHAQTESDRAKSEAERAELARRTAEEERARAEDLARKERERAERRGKLSTTLP
ncbi:MAG TPA: protein kinase [Kofleriaceae bacterium]|nr:protein kinase [Kofleriaceae bacterium]